MSQIFTLSKKRRCMAVLIFFFAVAAALIFISAELIPTLGQSNNLPLAVKCPEVGLGLDLASQLFCGLEDQVCPQENDIAWIYYAEDEEEREVFASEECQILACLLELNGNVMDWLHSELYECKEETFHLFLEENFNPLATSHEDGASLQDSYDNEVTGKIFPLQGTEQCNFPESLEGHGNETTKNQSKNQSLARSTPLVSKQHNAQESLERHGKGKAKHLPSPWIPLATEQHDDQGSLDSQGNGTIKNQSFPQTPQHHDDSQESLESCGNRGTKNQSFLSTLQVQDYNYSTQKSLFTQTDTDGYSFNWKKNVRSKLFSHRHGGQLQFLEETGAFLQANKNKNWFPHLDGPADDICQLVQNKLNHHSHLSESQKINFTSEEELEDATQNKETQFSSLKCTQESWLYPDQHHRLFGEKQDVEANLTISQGMFCPIRQIEDNLQSWDDIRCPESRNERDDGTFPVRATFQDRDYQQEEASILSSTEVPLVSTPAPDEEDIETFEDDFDPGRNIFLDRPPPPGLEPYQYSDTSTTNLFRVMFHREYHLETDIVSDRQIRPTFAAQLEEWRKQAQKIKKGHQLKSQEVNFTGSSKPMG